MDLIKKTLILVLLVICEGRVAALKKQGFGKPVVEILDGEVTVRWNLSDGAPMNSMYNVQFGRYDSNWTMVDSCKGITQTYCNLTTLIKDYHTRYKVKVGLATGNLTLGMKRFVLTMTDLRPPSFTLFPTSSALIILVHQNKILRQIFPYGLTYTIYLEERGRDSEVTIVSLKGNMEDDLTKNLTSLKWGSEYCVYAKVEGIGAVPVSEKSPKQCVVLPKHEWFTIAVIGLCFLGVLTSAAVMAAILLCYLKRPEKTPAVLKSPQTGWRPNSIADGPVEVVTDKGWFLFSYKPDEKNCIKDPVTHPTVTQEEGEDRRTSMDSGVSIVSNSSSKGGGESPSTRRDSGCGSMGGQESSTSSQTTVYQGERTDTHIARKREDSGVEMGSSNRQDSGSLKEAILGGSYRGQSPSAVQSLGCNSEETPLVLANVVTGYRAGPQSCICLGAGHCTWCHKQGLHGTGVIKQYRVNNGQRNSSCDFTDPYRGKHTISSYSKKTEIDIATVDDFQTSSIHLGETFPLLTALSSLPLVEGGQDFNMNNVPLSLCDVQLTND